MNDQVTALLAAAMEIWNDASTDERKAALSEARAHTGGSWRGSLATQMAYVADAYKEHTKYIIRCAWCERIRRGAVWVIATVDRSMCTDGICPTCAHDLISDNSASRANLAQLRKRREADTARRVEDWRSRVSRRGH